MNHERLEELRASVALAQSELESMLKGQRIRFKAWLVNGAQRTGTITMATANGRRISIGVAVDRVDGRPGVLVDNWYGDLNAVED